MKQRLPPEVIAGLGPDIDSARIVSEEPLHLGTGAATGGVTRLEAEVTSRDGASRTVMILRKRLVPLATGRHTAGAQEPRHWAYWRREAEAYLTGIVPVGPGLRAPVCYGAVDDELYLEEVTGERPPVERAAQVLAGWQQPWAGELDRPWLCVDQLAARVAVSHLDWSAVTADPRMAQLWDRRHALLARIADLPKVLSHGDHSLGNLIDTGDEVVALDWATIGWEPVGFDLAHLGLSAGADPTGAYLDATASVINPVLVARGFKVAVALVGSSRYHWMMTRSLEPPEWYVDFIWRHRPEGSD